MNKFHDLYRSRGLLRDKSSESVTKRKQKEKAEIENRLRGKFKGEEFEEDCMEM